VFSIGFAIEVATSGLSSNAAPTEHRLWTFSLLTCRRQSSSSRMKMGYGEAQQMGCIYIHRRETKHLRSVSELQPNWNVRFPSGGGSLHKHQRNWQWT
jgi:hypothetical protein